MTKNFHTSRISASWSQNSIDVILWTHILRRVFNKSCKATPRNIMLSLSSKSCFSGLVKNVKNVISNYSFIGLEILKFFEKKQNFFEMVIILFI